MVHETADSILFKEGRVEITLLFHSNRFCHKFMIIYTLKIYDYLLVLRFLSLKKISFDLKCVKSVYTFKQCYNTHVIGVM